MDCKKTKDFINVMKMMCDSGINCKTCPLSGANNLVACLCDDYIKQHPYEAIQVLQDWADKNIKTYAQDFSEKFPNVEKNLDNMPLARWCFFYDNGKRTHDCDYNCNACWGKTMEVEK